MANSSHSDDAPLVGVSASENTFLVPDVDKVKPISTDVSTVGKGNVVPVQGVFDRDVLLDTISISSADTPYINLTGNFDIWKRYLASTQIAQYTSSFDNIACDMILTIKIVVPGSCYGVYNAQVLCDGGYIPTSAFIYENDGPAVDDYHSSTQDEHAFINVELKNTVVFELPWVHFNDAVSLHDSVPIQCWRLLIWALAPIQNTVNPSLAAGTIQVYARMGESRSFHNLYFQGKKKAEDRYPTKVKTSKMIGSVASGVSMLGGMFPAIAPFAEPAAMGLAAVSTFADWLGFTRESYPELVTTVTHRMTSGLPNVDSQDSSEIVALSVANHLTIDPSIGGGSSIDPMSNAYLFEKWTIVDIFQIGLEDTGVVKTIPVTPYIKNATLGISYITTGGFVGLPFNNWRGGMEYMIYIPSSQNLEGALQVIWSPGVAALPAGDPTNRLANVIIDLHGTSRTTLTVGYAQPTPCLISAFWNVDTAPYPSTVNGRLIFYINAPLTAPRDGAYTVSVIVMARPCQDMVFGNPGSATFWDGFPVPVDSVVYQGEEDEEKDTSVILAHQSPYPTTEVLFGEQFESVRALIQHFSGIYVLAGKPTITAYWITRIPHYYPMPSNSLTGFDFIIGGASAASNSRPQWTYFGWYTAPFTGGRGSTRYKVMGSDGTPVGLAVTPLPGFANTAITDLANSRGLTLCGPGISGYQRLEAGNGVEFLVPGYGSNKYNLNRYIFANNAPVPSMRVDAFYTPSSLTNPLGPLYVAAGPDYTVNRFRRIPGVRLFAP
jgi:hypothetical protein